MTDDNSTVNESARGKVYIFNTTNQRVQLHLNEGSLSSIDPAGQKAGSYVPKFTTADRDDATSTPDNKFAQKDNTLYRSCIRRILTWFYISSESISCCRPPTATR
jgi:hypothetical protein